MTACRPRFPNPGKVAAGDITLVNGRKVIVHGSAIAAGKRDTMILPKWACGVLASPDKPMASGHARGTLTRHVQHGFADLAGGEGIDPQGLFHATGAGTLDRRAPERDIGRWAHLAPGKTRSFCLITPCRALLAKPAATTRQNNADERKAKERNATFTHDRKMRDKL